MLGSIPASLALLAFNFQESLIYKIAYSDFTIPIRQTAELQREITENQLSIPISFPLLPNGS